MKLSSLKAIHWWGDECIGLAAQDLARDMQKVAGVTLPVLHSRKLGENILSVGTVEDPDYREAAKVYLDAVPSQWEAYAASILTDRIVILGTDKRAAMWGIYKLSEKLGVLPCHRYSLTEPAKKDSLPTESWTDRPKTYRFRGWFLNDEDLLTKRRISGGKRDIDYLYYHDVCDVTSMEEAVETALRLNINLMIPGSIIDIDEPYQKALVDYCVKRGLYVTQHHIEPVGVSWWAYNNYYKRRNMEIPPYSFLQNREAMVRVWEHYVNLWAKYGGDVIWQLGLRGRADTPVWKADAAKMDAEGWGGYISDAMAIQYDLIRKAVGGEFRATATMWMEGAAMYAKGELKLPAQVMPIFSDVGITQMLSSDFFNTPRDPKVGRGLYYHAAYWGSGPHLALGNNPIKMLYNYDLAIAKGDTCYSILNVSNVREVLYSAAANSRVVWDRDSFDLEEFDRDFARDYFGREGLYSFFQEYFAAFIAGDITSDLAEKRRNSFDYVLQDVPFPYYPINDGDIRILGRYALAGVEYKKGWPQRFETSAKKFEALLKKVEAVPAAPYFEEYKLMTRFVICLSRWAENVWRYRDTGDKSCLLSAAEYLNTYLQDRKCMEQPPFENWYRGEDKMNIRKLCADTQTLAESC